MSQSNKENKSLSLNDVQREVLVGILLGDAHLETQTNGNSWRLCCEQAEKQHGEYLQHLYDIFRPFIGQEETSEKKGPKKQNLSFRTTVQDCLRYYAELFYVQKSNGKFKKRVPGNIKDLLTDRVLAYWYMDDGARKGPDRTGKTLHTEGFSYEEVVMLRDALNSIGILTSVNRQNRKPRSEQQRQAWLSDPNYNPVTGKKTFYILNIRAGGDFELTKRIAPYIHPQMEKKVYSTKTKHLKPNSQLG